jgi:hypothetical protein
MPSTMKGETDGESIASGPAECDKGKLVIVTRYLIACDIHRSTPEHSREVSEEPMEQDEAK